MIEQFMMSKKKNKLDLGKAEQQQEAPEIDAKMMHEILVDVQVVY